MLLIFKPKLTPSKLGYLFWLMAGKPLFTSTCSMMVFYQREKIVIQFSETHPKFANGLFQTKYYEINEPGRLSWGHKGEVMKLEYLHVA